MAIQVEATGFQIWYWATPAALHWRHAPEQFWQYRLPGELEQLESGVADAIERYYGRWYMVGDLPTYVPPAPPGPQE